MTTRFSNGDDYLELEILTDKSASQAMGDARVLIDVRSAGFCGNNDVWVSACNLRQFCVDLLQLEKRRSGEARLVSISPSELTLVIKSVDSLGHMGIFGSTGYDVHRDHGPAHHSVSFGFEVEPDQVQSACSVFSALLDAR